MNPKYDNRRMKNYNVIGLKRRIQHQLIKLLYVQSSKGNSVITYMRKYNGESFF